MSLLRRLRARALANPGHPALMWPAGEMDYATLSAAVERLAGQLRATGVDCLALALDNGPAWALLDLAALSCGICLLPLPGFFSPEQLRHALTQSGAQALLVAPDSPLTTLLADDEEEGWEQWTVAGQALTWRTLHPSDGLAVPAGIHTITYTSGTTGSPKGVMLEWRHIEPVVASLAAAVGMRPGDRHLALAPLSILLENIAGLYVPLWSGATSVLPPLADVGLRGSSRLDPAVMAGALDDWRANSAIFFPQTLQALVEWIEAGHSAPGALRFAAVGGAALSPRLLRRAHAVGVPVFEGYGLSECASVVCLNTPDANRPGSVGRPLPHVRVAVSSSGDIRVAGPGFAGYQGQPPATDEWWETGDTGSLDEDGFLYLHGRRRHVFITAFGRNVSPEWLEHELILEAAIAQAVVFGEARPWNAAVITAAPGADQQAVDAAVERVNAGLPDYARVRDWLPADTPFNLANGQLTATGRVRRTAIQQHYAGAIDRLYQQEYSHD